MIYFLLRLLEAGEILHILYTGKCILGSCMNANERKMNGDYQQSQSFISQIIYQISK